MAEERLLGKDKNGREVRVGDRVRGTTSGGTTVEGRALTNGVRRYVTIAPDSGASRGIPLSTVEVVDPAEPSAQILGVDKNGREVREGDRVRGSLRAGATGSEGIAVPNIDGYITIRTASGPAATAKLLLTERVPLGKDKEGNAVYERDRVSVESFGLGTVRGKEGDSGRILFVDLDDGTAGSGPNGAFRVNPEDFVVLVAGVDFEEEKDQPSAESAPRQIGSDKNGTSIYVGSRVRAINSSLGTGTVTDVGPQRFLQVKLDNGEVGVGPNGEFLLVGTEVLVREALTNDKNGKPIYEGDKVTVDRPRDSYTATVASYVTEGRGNTPYLLVQRDDGKPGAGPNREYGAKTQYVTVLSNPDASPQEAKPIGKDSDGNDVFVGSTVLYDGGAGRLRATVKSTSPSLGFVVEPLEDRRDGFGRTAFSTSTERVVVIGARAARDDDQRYDPTITPVLPAEVATPAPDLVKIARAYLAALRVVREPSSRILPVDECFRMETVARMIVDGNLSEL